MVRRLCERGFEATVLQELQPPAAGSLLVGLPHWPGIASPTLFMSASHGIVDRTRDCWWAYLSGPYLHDRSRDHGHDAATDALATRLCHVTAHEVGGEHRTRVLRCARHGRAAVDRRARTTRFDLRGQLLSTPTPAPVPRRADRRVRRGGPRAARIGTQTDCADCGPCQSDGTAAAARARSRASVLSRVEGTLVPRRTPPSPHANSMSACGCCKA